MVYVFFAEGTEELEFISVVDVLRRAGIETKAVAASDTKELKGAHGIGIVLDMTVDEIDETDCEMIVLPGGMPGTINLYENERLTEMIKERISEGKPMAAICAAPLVLARNGALKGRRATIFPGREQELTDGGAAATGERTVVDGNIITGKGPGAALEFALALTEFLKGKEKAEEIKNQMLII